MNRRFMVVQQSARVWRVVLHSYNLGGVPTLYLHDMFWQKFRSDVDAVEYIQALEKRLEQKKAAQELNDSVMEDLKPRAKLIEVQNNRTISIIFGPGRAEAIRQYEAQREADKDRGAFPDIVGREIKRGDE